LEKLPSQWQLGFDKRLGKAEILHYSLLQENTSSSSI
jgi:hypothetical protein